MNDNFKWVDRVLKGMIDVRDSSASAEAENVAQLARNVGRDLGLPEISLGNLWLAGIVHDVGKVLVPVEILSKTGALDRYERNIVESHVEVSLRVIDESSLPAELSRILAQHHERLDGSGYPARLKGDQISLEARILAVADVFTAISREHSYRAGAPEKTAKVYLLEHVGVLYDPTVVNAFFRVLKGNG